MRRRAVAALVAAAASLAAAPGAHAAPAYDDAGYFAFADRLVAQLAPTWDPAAGFYETGAPVLDSRYNAALLTVFATAAAAGHQGAARDDERARALADRLTQSPPFSTATTPPWADPMFHTPGWIGSMSGAYDVMDKAIDPKIAEGLVAAWQARAALGLSPEVAGRIRDEIEAVAHSPFFRYPSVRLNQINWPAELYAYDATVTGSPHLLRADYRRQVRRFVAGVTRPWQRGGSTTLSRTLRFHYQVNEAEGARRNVDSAEYANMTLQFLAWYDQALAAGMKPLPRADLRILRAWVRRDLFGYWMHSGFLSWDSGLGYRRWMKAKTWAYALQGLETIATADAFDGDPAWQGWAKELFDRSLDFYDRQRPADGGLSPSAIFDVDPASRSLPDARILAARMAANAARAITLGLGRMRGTAPPPFYAFDPDIGRLAVSTPAYGTAVIVVNRSAFPYGGLELARLYDGQGDPIGAVGARPPAAFAVNLTDTHGRRVISTAAGLHVAPRHAPLVVHTAAGTIARTPKLPHAYAGTFSTLEATGERRTRGLVLTTRHRFDAAGITERWTVRRTGPRKAWRPLRVDVLAPSWGGSAAISAELSDGRVLPLPPGESVPMHLVTRFLVDSDRGAYWLTPVGRHNGIATAMSVPAQRSSPTPGPTLRITPAHAARFRAVTLEARITPLAERPR